MPASVNSLSAICYGLGLIAFVAFSCQLAVRLTGNWRTRALLAASALSALWESMGLMAAIWPTELASLSYELVDSARYGAWLVVICLLLPGMADRTSSVFRNSRVWIALGASAVVAMATLAGRAAAESTGAESSAWIFGAWVAACVYGVVVCEQLFRT